jgi:hypothetical protein
MTFEFMYGDSWYKYENGWILKQDSFGDYDRYSDNFCPVPNDLNNNIESFSIDQLKIIMAAILHGYSYGVSQGKKHKIQEFKRVFQLD